jgi:hypothetical protein
MGKIKKMKMSGRLTQNNLGDQMIEQREAKPSKRNKERVRQEESSVRNFHLRVLPGFLSSIFVFSVRQCRFVQKYSRGSSGTDD